MRTTTAAAVVAACLLSACASVAPPPHIDLTEAQRQKCETGGGCLVMTKDSFERALAVAAKVGASAAEAECSAPSDGT